ncbi:MAG: hypothetical protein RLZZ232_3366 [Planctomycetota bacterium]|jgi:uncharacterized protein (TIGR00251 family)
MMQREQISAAVQDAADGSLLLVHVQPKARRNQLCGMHADRLKVAVTEPPDKGKATAAVLALIATALHVPLSRLTVLRGEISRRKDIHVQGIAAAVIVERLLQVLSDTK